MRQRQRPAALEYAVFGSAFVLSLIVGYYGYKHFTTETPRPVYIEPAAAPQPYRPPSGVAELQGSGTVSGVTILPGAKATGPQKPRKKR